MRLLNKGVKTFIIRVVASDRRLPASKFEIELNIRSKRRLDLNQNNSNRSGNFQVLQDDNSKTIINPKNDCVFVYVCKQLMLVDSTLCL